MQINLLYKEYLVCSLLFFKNSWIRRQEGDLCSTLVSRGQSMPAELLPEDHIRTFENYCMIYCICCHNTFGHHHMCI